MMKKKIHLLSSSVFLILSTSSLEAKAQLSLQEQLKNCEIKAQTFTNHDGDVMDGACFDVVKSTAGRWGSVKSTDGSIEVYGSKGLLYQKNTNPDIGVRFNSGRGANASIKDVQSLALNSQDDEVYAYDSSLNKLFSYDLNYFGDCRPIRGVQLSELAGAAGITYVPVTAEIGIAIPSKAEVLFVPKVADQLNQFPVPEVKVSGNIKGPRSRLTHPLALTWDPTRAQILVLDQTDSGGVIRAYSGTGRGDIPPVREKFLPQTSQNPASIQYEGGTDRLSVILEDGSALSLDARF